MKPVLSKAAPAWALASVLTLGAAPPTAAAAESALALKPCRLAGLENEALCGVLSRPLDPSQPAGTRIDVHVAVLPALARNKRPDPVFLLAGGPGQSAIALAPQAAALFARLQNRRDVVLVDQRGTGRSAPLQCPEPPSSTPLRERLDNASLLRELVRCRERLQALPHGDLTRYTTTLAMQDIDAVRRALGAARINLVGGSYGTRAVLEVQRQFPQTVRRAVLDGLAPPDMVLPASFSPDSQAALDALLAACEADAGCRARHPQLRTRWQGLLASLPREVSVIHPLTGAREAMSLTPAVLLNALRMPLYVPALAAALPAALDAATAGRLEPLMALTLGMATRRESQLAMGQHFSVVCAEDVPRVAGATEVPGADFGRHYAELYTRVCADWPRAAVEPAFYTVPPAPAATLLLSGGADPATPPRHGERVARALGPLARHVVVPQAGHGVMGLPCMRDVLFRFIDAPDDAAALAVDSGCAAGIPRPPAFVPYGLAATAAEGAR